MARWVKEVLPKTVFRPDLGAPQTDFIPFRSRWAPSATQIWVHAAGARCTSFDTTLNDFVSPPGPVGMIFTADSFNGITYPANNSPNGDVGVRTALYPGHWLDDDDPDGVHQHNMLLVDSFDDGARAMYARSHLYDIGDRGPFPMLGIQFMLASLTDPADDPDSTDLTFTDVSEGNRGGLWASAVILYKIEE
jgi:hypothetical protein